MTELIRKSRAVLFDLDETLTDAPAGLDAAHRAVAKRLCDYLCEKGIEVSETAVRSKLRALDDRMNLETRYNRDEWWPELLADLGLKRKMPRRMLKELTELYWSAFTRGNKPYPDAELTLSHLKEKGYKLGLVTDTDGIPGAKMRRVKRLGLARFFDVIVVGGEDTARTKPGPEPFLLAAEKLGVPPRECAVVGDKPFTDIRGAKAAGMLAVLLKRRDWGVAEQPDAAVGSLSELEKLFSRKAKRSRGSAPSARRARRVRAQRAARRWSRRSSR